MQGSLRPTHGRCSARACFPLLRKIATDSSVSLGKRTAHVSTSTSLRSDSWNDNSNSNSPPRRRCESPPRRSPPRHRDERSRPRDRYTSPPRRREPDRDERRSYRNEPRREYDNAPRRPFDERRAYNDSRRDARREFRETSPRARPRKRKLRVRYQSLADDTTERVIRPLALTCFGRVWLLSAWCELRNDFRHFRTDRVERLTVLAESFEDEPGKRYEDMRRAG